MNTPEQHRKFGRRAFIGGAAAAGLAAIVGCKTGESSTPPPTTVNDTIPATTSIPDTTTSIPATTSSTEAPTTTVPERVFASPEQKAQVEAVEARLLEFFKITKPDILKYRETVDFIPHVSGLSTIKTYPAPDDNSYRMLGVNLGTIPVPTGESTTELGVIGYVDHLGNKFVQIYVQYIMDPEFTQMFPNRNDRAVARLDKPLREDAGIVTYVVDDNNMTATNVVESTSIPGAENILAALNDPNNVGAPIVIECGTDYNILLGQRGYSYDPDPTLAPIVKDLYTSAKVRKLNEELAQYLPEELNAIGILTDAEIPQDLLKFESLRDLLGSIPLGGSVVFLDQIPHLISDA